MIVTCPNCSTGYLLPEHLVGPGGARVRCPRCQHLFAVGVDGQPRDAAAPAPAGPPPERPIEAVEEPAATGATTAGTADPATMEPGTAAESGAGEPVAIARAVLEQFAADRGDAIDRARAEHRFFAEFGPALMAAYESYCSRAGADADPSAFRTALRERWGVELVPLTAREG